MTRGLVLQNYVKTQRTTLNDINVFTVDIAIVGPVLTVHIHVFLIFFSSTHLTHNLCPILLLHLI
jgi:hypothetical protein